MGTAPQFYPRTMFARPRVFGDDLAPPRQAYFTVIPCILILAGVASWTLGDDTGFVIASGIATLFGLYLLWDWLFRGGVTRLSTLLAMTLLLGYGGGALNTWATLPRGSLSISAVFGLYEGVLARGMGAVLVSSAVLLFLGEIFEKPIFGRDFRLTIDNRIRRFIYAGTLAMLAGYLHHSIGFGGTVSAEGHESYFGSFLAWLYPSLIALAVAAFLTARSGLERILSAIACLCLLMLLVFLGRRAAIYSTVEVLFVLELCGFQLRKLSLRKVLLILAMGGVIIACSLTFMLLRIAGYSIRHQQEASVGKRIAVAGQLLQRGDAYAMAASTTQRNIQSRTFVIGFFASILDGSLSKPTAMGRDAAGEFQLAIPSVLYPGKDRYFSEEELVDQQFGFGYGDSANSILTAGATDFGLIGVIAYPLLIVALCRLIYDLAAGWLRMAPLLVVALALIYILLQTEITLSGYFDSIRAMLAFGLLIAMFMAIPTIRLRANLH